MYTCFMIFTSDAEFDVKIIIIVDEFWDFPCRGIPESYAKSIWNVKAVFLISMPEFVEGGTMQEY